MGLLSTECSLMKKYYVFFPLSLNKKTMNKNKERERERDTCMDKTFSKYKNTIDKLIKKGIKFIKTNCLIMDISYE